MSEYRSPRVCSGCRLVFFTAASEPLDDRNVHYSPDSYSAGMVAALDLIGSRQRCPRCGSRRLRRATEDDVNRARVDGQLSGKLPWETETDLAALIYRDALEPYLNASLLLCLGSVISLGGPLAGPLVFITPLIHLSAWLYLLSASSSSRIARAIFFTSVVAALIALAIATVREIGAPSVAELLLDAIPWLSLHPNVFGPVVTLQGMLYAYAIHKIPWTTTRSRALVFGGSVALASVSVLAMASGAFTVLPNVYWAGLPGIGYALLSAGLAHERKAKASSGRMTHTPEAPESAGLPSRKR